MSDRFVTSRAKLGSPQVWDTLEQRSVLVVVRKLDNAGEPSAVGSAADAEAVRISELCAWALNRSHARALTERAGRGA